MEIQEKIHIFEKSRLVTDNFTQEAVTATYVGALAALHKQTPKEPNDKMELMDFAQQIYTYRGDCPVCGMEGLVSTRDRYCHNCGQAIDWEDEK